MQAKAKKQMPYLSGSPKMFTYTSKLATFQKFQAIHIALFRTMNVLEEVLIFLENVDGRQVIWTKSQDS